MPKPPREIPILNDGPVEMIAVEELLAHLHPDNPNEGDIGKIVESIETNGWYGVIYRQRSTGYVLAGEHRIRAGAMCGMPELPVQWVNADDRRAAKILLIDNAGARAGAWNDSELAEMLSMLAVDDEGLAGTGFDGDDLDDLLKLLEDLPPEPKERAPSYKVTVKCRDDEHRQQVLAQLVSMGLEAK